VHAEGGPFRHGLRKAIDRRQGGGHDEDRAERSGTLLAAEMIHQQEKKRWLKNIAEGLQAEPWIRGRQGSED
jgi:hypothetical protein